MKANFFILQHSQTNLANKAKHISIIIDCFLHAICADIKSYPEVMLTRFRLQNFVGDFVLVHASSVLVFVDNMVGCHVGYAVELSLLLTLFQNCLCNSFEQAGVLWVLVENIVL